MAHMLSPNTPCMGAGRTSLALSLVVCTLAGCSGGAASVTGGVTLDSEPMPGGKIFFLPDGNPAGRPSAETSISSGKYCLPAKLGLKPGRHRVEIVWHKPPPGKEHLKPGDPGFTTDNWVQTIPSPYNRETTLFEDLKAGANHFDFALKKQP